MARIVVIGSGVFGAWSAWHLAAAGHRVTLVDGYGPANGRASSADHSRVIRAGYGADEIYSDWATRSLKQWLWLAAETNHELLVRSGALFMAPPGSDYVDATAATLSRLGLPVTLLTPRDIVERFPQIDSSGLGNALFEANAGVLRSRMAVQALVRLMRARGLVEYRIERVISPDEQLALPRFKLASREELSADAYVCACGPWLSSFLSASVGSLIRVTRQEVLYFGIPSGDARFGLDTLPVWIDFEAGLYGIPDLDAQGFKVGIDRHGSSIDPDNDDRLVTQALVDQTRAWLARRFPALHDVPLVDARVCQYENTCNGDFLIDRHPAWPNVWIAGGGSGHGFKHGPIVGQHVADLVNGRIGVNPRFSIASKTADAKRAVY